MADMVALKNDVVKALGLVPPEVLRVLHNVAETLVTKEREGLEKALPQVLELLKPHAGAVMMEMATGILDKSELESALMDALKEAGANGPTS
jgi:hypothetical protein